MGCRHCGLWGGRGLPSGAGAAPLVVGAGGVSRGSVRPGVVLFLLPMGEWKQLWRVILTPCQLCSGLGVRLLFSVLVLGRAVGFCALLCLRGPHCMPRLCPSDSSPRQTCPAPWLCPSRKGFGFQWELLGWGRWGQGAHTQPRDVGSVPALHTPRAGHSESHTAHRAA